MRPLTAGDEPIVWEMLRYAAHESSLEALQHPLLARYTTGWGRPGDVGYGAWRAATPIGAAWLRLWSGGDKGFGYIRDDIPELSIGVAPDYRGQGVGTRLLTQLLAAAKGAFPAVSLSVRGDNPAVRLYSRVGFVPVSGSEILNRTGSESFNMICALEV
ncbi:Mycothiol acetyltransferase [Halomicronema hongdechloris C2206]|uniref:Mycothiol acetyltransferase n=1 Tax=Halomicronema hongdechloris C2206 TaxID=1641165 RepID=A0A1Z3HV53_9CYAN|nr:GNAT family N-acetyltransferase [Halomicronema hongdechloris]ASC74152.1 Mycothiol acetyltransferase [Halomicronema hongdechloris C2206]